MPSLTEFFLSSKSSIVQLELLEISHSSFSKVHRIVRNAVNGVTVTLEDMTVRIFDYYPMRITKADSQENLDFQISVDFGDLGEVLPTELDAVRVAGTFDEKPVIKYRTYRSDDLSAPLFGPFTLEMGNINFTRKGATFEAKAPSVGVLRTGEYYSLDVFPGLQDFL